jgi:biotin transport system permease protein
MLALHSPHKTIFHRWPAELKLTFLLGITTLLFVINDLLILGIFSLLPFAAAVSQGRFFFKFLLKLLWPLWPFITIICLWHGFTGQVEAGLRVLLRMVAAVGFANLVTVTTAMDKLIKVIFTCLHPLRRFGLRPERIAFAIGLFIRFTPVLIEKSAILAQAYRARTSKYGNWRIVLPLALIAVDDADHIAEAIRARGGLEQL